MSSHIFIEQGMEKLVEEQLLDSLETLGDEKLKIFHRYLQDPRVLGRFPVIQQSQLETADDLDTANLIWMMYTHDAMKVTELILKKINQGTTKSPAVFTFSSSNL